jgi:hypothetical protein
MVLLKPFFKILAIVCQIETKKINFFFHFFEKGDDGDFRQCQDSER